MSASGIIERPHCPRCRYDLSGPLSSWREQCPQHGVCPECGLTFEWPDLLRLDRQRDERFIEHTSKWWRLLRAAWRTWWRALYPPGFWRWVKLHHEVRPRRMVLWLALLLVPLWLAQGFLNAAAPIIEQQLWQSFTRMTWAQPVSALCEPFVTFDEYYGWGATTLTTTCRVFPSDLWPPAIRGILAMQFAWVMMLTLLPWTLAQAKVRSAHITRATVYSMAWLVLVAALAIAWACDRLYTSLPTNPVGLMPWYADGPADFLSSGWGELMLGVVPLWLTWWWYVVIVRHWRVQRGRLVWSVLLIPVLLFAAIVYFWPT